jgi:hypothetical protein
MPSPYHLGIAGQDDRKLIFSAVGMRRNADVYHKTDPITSRCVGHGGLADIPSFGFYDKGRKQLYSLRTASMG